MTKKASGIETVNIRPGVSILSVLRHLNYRPWFALAEFVDNALQSFLSNRDAIKNVDRDGPLLRIAIELDTLNGGRIVIRDNAAGICESEYRRAFRPAEIPPDRSGLCEFGMGMKSAACWFASRWHVRTSALGEQVERTISFDINRIVQDRIEELEISSRTIPASDHFTEIALTDLHHRPQGRTIAKIQEHLASIYRVFLRTGILQISFNGEILKYEDPDILNAPHYKNTGGHPILWRKEIDFDFGMGQGARGFAALRARASTSLAGFALFRRNRLIQGSGDETYRPEFIFGKSNSYRYQRLFGELHLEGFEISHTKDGFRWDENEDVFLEVLKEHLEEEPLNLLQQAEEFRVRAPQQDLNQGAVRATVRTAETIERDVPPILEHQISEEPVREPPPREFPPTQARAATREIDIELREQPWRIILETTLDPAIGDWVSVSDRSDILHSATRQRVRQVGVRMSLAHPFMDRFCGADENTIEALLRVAAAIVLAETAARDVGATLTNTIIRNINELLRNGLSRS